VNWYKTGEETKIKYY